MYEINKKYVLEQTTTIINNNKSIDVSVVNAKDGNKTLTINDKYVYSKYTPIENAKLQINVNNNYDKSDVIIIFGSGLMYEVIEILEKVNKKVHIVILEPSYYVFDQCLKNIDTQIELQNIEFSFYFWGGSKSLKEFFMELDFYKNLYKQPKKILWYDSLGYINTFSEEYVQYKSLIVAPVKSGIDKYGNSIYRKLLLDNYVSNLIGYTKGYNAKILKNIMIGKSVIIVSAGPSLNKNIEYIKKVQDKCLIIAVYRAVPILEKYGVKPHLVVTMAPEQDLVDSHKNGMEYTLLSDICANKRIEQKNKGENIYYKSSMADELENLYSSELLNINAINSVAHQAFELCLYMGVNNIILTGQDLAYDGENSHAFGIDEDESVRKRISTKGYYGEVVETTNIWNEIKVWFEERAKEISDLTLINATEGGAYINGFINRKLSEVVDEIQPYKPNEIVKQSISNQANTEIIKINYALDKLKKHIELIQNLNTNMKFSELKDYIDKHENLSVFDDITKMLLVQNKINYKGMKFEELYSISVQQSIKYFVDILEGDV